MTANIYALRFEADELLAKFHAALQKAFPGRSEWDWKRAVAAAAGQSARRNDDTTQDEALASDPEIKAAWDAYITALHAYYRARFGDNGVLGGKGTVS